MTPRERDLVEAIRRLTVDGIAPTYDELATELGYASKSRIFYLMNALERQGMIRRQASGRRQAQITTGNSAYTADALKALSMEELEALRALVNDILTKRAGVVRFPPRLRVAT